MSNVEAKGRNGRGQGQGHDFSKIYGRQIFDYF